MTNARRGPVSRVAMLSAHTSPLEQPGNGDAGGMNVYVLELARRLAARDVAVEIFTRATSSQLPPIMEPHPGVTVRHVDAGPYEALTKGDLPAQLCTFVRDVLRVEAAHDSGYYDVIHSHYWLSGQVGTVARERWSVPLVHSMHTMAKVKNASLAEGDAAEPIGRLLGEEQIVELADRLIANTADEARQLVDMYAADPAKVEVVHPGVDLAVFGPRDQAASRARLGLPHGGDILLFAGRIQPLKAPDVLLKAAAALVAARLERRADLAVVIVGGPSGTGLERPRALETLAAELGIADLIRFVPTVTQSQLADYYAAASLVCVPSYNESFGLVALEAQACGTPVVAAAVGGLTTAVRDGVSGLLVPGHEPGDYAEAFESILSVPARRAMLSRGARTHAASFGWDETAEQTLEVYARALAKLYPVPSVVSL